MPERIVRPGILTSERISRLSWAAEVLYRRLMSVVDDYGRFDGRPAILRPTLYPLKLELVTERDIEKWTRECAEAALVTVYTVENKAYLQVERFGQRMRAKTSKYPPPPADAGERMRMHANAGLDGDGDVKDCLRNPPPTPLPGGKGIRSRVKIEVTDEEIPKELQIPEFLDLWSKYKENRRKMRKPVTEISAKQSLADMAKWGPKIALEQLRKTVRAGWQGIPDPNGQQAPPDQSGPPKPKDWNYE